MADVRVVAGTARGRKLATLQGTGVRPTTDRVREAVCNALGSMGAIDGARVLDLFAGSGALGIEALSRGAASVVFVEPDRSARRAIEENLITTGFADAASARVVASTAEGHLAGCEPNRYDLVFVDPPYAFDDWATLFTDLDPVVADGGVVVAESDHEIHPPDPWVVFRARRYASTVVGISVRTEAPPSPLGAEQ